MGAKDEPVIAWHWVRDDLTLRDGNTVAAGYVYQVPREDVRICNWGLHASRKALDGLGFAQGAQCCRVECSDIVEEDSNKLVCASRKVLWVVDATRTLHEFACDEAERALALVEDPDPRSVNAIKVKRAWLEGKASDEQLAAARDAARAAATAAATAAAWVAANAWDAANAAAWAAAWAAATAAATAAANAAAWTAANQRLEALLLALGGA